MHAQQSLTKENPLLRDDRIDATYVLESNAFKKLFPIKTQPFT